MALKAFRYKTWQTHKSDLKEKGRGAGTRHRRLRRHQNERSKQASKIANHDTNKRSCQELPLLSPLPLSTPSTLHPHPSSPLPHPIHTHHSSLTPSTHAAP